MPTGRPNWQNESPEKVRGIGPYSPEQELSRPLLSLLIAISFTTNLFISILDHLLHIRDPDTKYLGQDLFGGLKFHNSKIHPGSRRAMPNNQLLLRPSAVLDKSRKSACRRPFRARTEKNSKSTSSGENHGKLSNTARPSYYLKNSCHNKLL